jgi:hypothetical protein
MSVKEFDEHGDLLYPRDREKATFVLASDYDALATELQGVKDELYSVDKAAKQFGERIAQLEAALTKFLVWNGTDYDSDELRDYALTGICEEAYALIPASASETPAQSPPENWYCPNCSCDLCGAVQGRLERTAAETAGKHPFTGDGGEPCVKCGRLYENHA